MNKECKRRNRTDKPWRKRNRGSYGKPLELCLCATCANSFYLMEDHYIKRTAVVCVVFDMDSITGSTITAGQRIISLYKGDILL